jgi:hypothetical protein
MGMALTQGKCSKTISERSGSWELAQKCSTVKSAHSGKSSQGPQGITPQMAVTLHWSVGLGRLAIHLILPSRTLQDH